MIAEDLKCLQCGVEAGQSCPRPRACPLSLQAYEPLPTERVTDYSGAGVIAAVAAVACVLLFLVAAGVL